MAKTFEQECAEGRFEFNPNRSFEERCEIVRRSRSALFERNLLKDGFKIIEWEDN